MTPARALRLALPAIVGVSTLLHWLAARRFTGFWILPDEAVYARRGVELWQHASLPLLHGEGAGYGVLYPALVGLPLGVGDFAAGYSSAKLLQALVMSLAAVPVVLWGRDLVAPRWRLVAAILTVSSPLLLYSGLVMTEVLYYPVAALALWAIARAVATPTPRAQLLGLAAASLAVLTRAQAVVLLGAWVLALVLDAAFARDLRRARRSWPVVAVLAVAVAVALAAPGVFGAYSSVVGGGYPLGESLRLTFDHAVWIAVATGILPAAALVLLAIRCATGREGDPAVRALVAVALAATALVVVQVGFFAGRFAPHLLERDLAALPPVLFLAFAVWLDRGAPRPRVLTAVVAVALLGAVVATHWDDLTAAEALPDSFSLALLWRLREHDVATLVSLAVAVLLAALALVPRRAIAVLPALVLVALVASSLAAEREIGWRVRFDQANVVGSPRDWIDRAARGRGAAYLYAGEEYANGVWQALVWNSSVDTVAALAPAALPAPLPARTVHPAPDGSLRLSERYIAATNITTFRGEPVGAVEQPTTVPRGSTVWRLDPPARISTTSRNVQWNGDIGGAAEIDVWDCGGGSLELTLLPKETQVLTVLLDGRRVLRRRIAGLPVWRGSAPAPRSPAPRVCHYRIEGQGLLGSTRIEFVRR